MVAEKGPAEQLSDPQIDRRLLLLTLAIATLVLPGTTLVNVLSLAQEAERAGRAHDWGGLILLEGSSAICLWLLVPAVALLERRAPRLGERTALAALLYGLGSVGFSLLHVGGMWLLRSLAAELSGSETRFLSGGWSDLLYEYRKDVGPYLAMLAGLLLLRGLFEARREAALARAEARSTGRMVLRSGGRRIFVEPMRFVWAKAAGNYVEVRFGGREHLVRMALADFGRQLTEAGVEVVQISRSVLVNRAELRETRPTRSGDFSVRLADGTELRGSRRYRDALD